jgi:hypothetical protein
MNPGTQRRGQPDIARYDKGKPPHPADPREVGAQYGAVWVIVVAEDDAGEVARQPGDNLPRIGQPRGVREQP